MTQKLIRPIPLTAIDLIKRFEGVKLSAYQDSAGVWTIGYGSTHGVTTGMQITQGEAEERLSKDLARHARGVIRYIRVPLNDAQYGALVSFTFNLGIGALQRSTLRQKLNRGEYHAAAEEFPRWSYAGGRWLRGLYRRRLAEQAMFLSV